MVHYAYIKDELFKITAAFCAAKGTLYRFVVTEPNRNNDRPGQGPSSFQNLIDIVRARGPLIVVIGKIPDGPLGSLFIRVSLIKSRVLDILIQMLRSIPAIQSGHPPWDSCRRPGLHFQLCWHKSVRLFIPITIVQMENRRPADFLLSCPSNA